MTQTLREELTTAEQDLAVQDEKLRSGPKNLFESSSGNFWDAENTRDYVLARMAVVNCLKKMKERMFVELGLKHCIELLQLCRSDQVGLRDEIPVLMLRLGRDQECYDFIKWWDTSEADDHWDDMKHPPWKSKQADAYEDTAAVFTSRIDEDELHDDIHHLVDMTLLKIKLLIDVHARQTEIKNAEHDNTPVYVSKISVGRLGQLDTVDSDKLSAVLQDQIKTLYRLVTNGNKFFWSLLFHATPATLKEPLKYPFDMGGSSEALLMVQLYKETWDGVSGAMEILQAAMGP
jgi:hypothetical protein